MLVGNAGCIILCRLDKGYRQETWPRDWKCLLGSSLGQAFYPRVGSAQLLLHYHSLYQNPWVLNFRRIMLNEPFKLQPCNSDYSRMLQCLRFPNMDHGEVEEALSGSMTRRIYSSGSADYLNSRHNCSVPVPPWNGLPDCFKTIYLYA
jgi:hypothetical protein